MHELDRVKREKLRWACRRGMLELDLFLVPFFENKYDSLPLAEQGNFEEMLHHTDPELLSWLMGHETPTVANIQTIVTKIREFRLQN
uniref:FAD assembly factor SdhE n=2 Tax=Candidatus Berkiella aquae TaxID=295108 RepID=A0A0Q9YKK0_9GAMM